MLLGNTQRSRQKKHPPTEIQMNVHQVTFGIFSLVFIGGIIFGVHNIIGNRQRWKIAEEFFG